MGCLAHKSATKWLLKTCLLWLILHVKLSLQQDVAGLLCISECTTCPVICSPPPPPSPKKSPPLPMPSPPSETYFLSSPPPPPSSSPPPLSSQSPPPPPAAPKKSSSSASPPPPPSWFYFTAPSLPPPPEKSNAPPSRPGVTLVNPTTPGARDNSNPYNYFVYASHASSSNPRAFLFFFLLGATFLFRVVLWY